MRGGGMTKNTNKKPKLLKGFKLFLKRLEIFFTGECEMCAGVREERVYETGVMVICSKHAGPLAALIGQYPKELIKIESQEVAK